MASEARRHETAGWLVMAVALGLAVLSWRIAVDRDRHEAELRFDAAGDGLAAAIIARIDRSEFALRAAAALFDASEQVERDEWRRFVDALRPLESGPGIAAMGFARSIGPTATIELLEPIEDPRNLRAIGVDMATEGVRRAALTLAGESGRPALSGPVLLLQDEGSGTSRPGVLLYQAVYRAPSARPSDADADARPRGTLLGWVYSPMRIDELMRGLLPPDPPGIAFELFDADAGPPGTLLHASASGAGAALRGERVLELPGRRWTLRLAGSGAFEEAARSQRPALVAAVGALTVLVLGLYLRSEAKTRTRALDEARRLSAEVEARRDAEQAMRDSDRRFRDVVEASPVGLLMSDPDGRIVLANPQAERLFGYGPDELIGTGIDVLLPDAAGDVHAALRADSPRTDSPRAPDRRPMSPGRDLRGRRRDGTDVPLEIGLS
ncbi:MAG: PAS domain S-box protein, partial [Burkholderiales bacterium]